MLRKYQPSGGYEKLPRTNSVSTMAKSAVLGCAQKLVEPMEGDKDGSVLFSKEGWWRLVDFGGRIGWMEKD